MRLRFAPIGIFLGAALLACGRVEEKRPDTAAGGVPSAAGPWVVTATGLGPIRVGQTLSQVFAALGERPFSYSFDETCDYVRPTRLPPGVSLMVVRDTVVRLDVDSIGVRTALGAGVGDPETRVIQLYFGRVRVEPHKYTGPEGHYLVVRPLGDTLHRIIFETDGKRVINFRAGRRPAVEYVEGCL